MSCIFSSMFLSVFSLYTVFWAKFSVLSFNSHTLPLEFSTCGNCQNKNLGIIYIYFFLCPRHPFGQQVLPIRFPFLLPLHLPLGSLACLPMITHQLTSFLCLRVAFTYYRIGRQELCQNALCSFIFLGFFTFLK